MAFQTFLLHIEKKNNCNLTLGLLHSYCSCVLELLLLPQASLTVKTEVCPQVCALGTFEKAAHLRNSTNCLLVGEGYPGSRAACLCTQCSLDFWACSHWDTQPGKHLLGHSVWLLPWIQPSADQPLSHCDIAHLYLPVSGARWTLWIYVPAAVVLVSEDTLLCFREIFFCLVSICFKSGGNALKLLCALPLPGLVMGCISLQWLQCSAFLCQHWAAWAPFAVSASCAHLFCFWSCLVSSAHPWKFDTEFLSHSCSLVSFRAWLVKWCKHKEVAVSFRSNSLLCDSNGMAPFQSANIAGQGCMGTALQAWHICALWQPGSWHLFLLS